MYNLWKFINSNYFQAKEINSSGLPQKGVDNTNTTVVISVNDLNDNKPTFSSSNYNATVTEEITGIPITIIGNIIVNDIDKDVSAKTC